MSKLRLSFLHSLGGSVEIGDVISRSASTNLDTSRLVSHKYRDLLNATYIKNNNVIMGDNEVLIISFAPRVNKGEQNSPSLPVLIQIKGDNLWMPNIDALIKLQYEHDKAMGALTDPNGLEVNDYHIQRNYGIVTDPALISECFERDQEEYDKQLDTVASKLRNAGYFVQIDALMFMQDEGMLAEVLLPLK